MGNEQAGGMAPLVVRGLTKRYPQTARPALSGLDLTLMGAERVAVVGPSGCGKTTLLRLIAGLEIPDAGEVRLLDRCVVGPDTWVPPERRGIGLVFQDFALFPHLSVAANVAYGLRHLNRRERRQRVAEMLTLVELEGLERRFPHQLSGGQQQRVALARALAPSPRLLLLDEPFSNLDAPLKKQLRGSLGRMLDRAGVPVLLVVHDVEDVMQLADRVVVLRDGVAVREGTPTALRDTPGDDYVDGFFGMHAAQ